MTLDLIKIRRDLHQIPEIGLEEFKTQAYLLERIAEMTEGKDFVEQRTWRTGILVYLHGHAPEKTIGWRTDIDYSTHHNDSIVFDSYLVTDNGTWFDTCIKVTFIKQGNS